VAAVRPLVILPARLYLVGATTHLAEGWRSGVRALELAGDSVDFELERAVRREASALGVGVLWESPSDVIPLPGGWRHRARAAPRELDGPGGLTVKHFDPYSVVLRGVTRGDEADYLVALEFLRRGWIEAERLEQLHAEVVPQFTRATLAQDPAEFRRKFAGLKQLIERDRAAAAGSRHGMSETGASWL
jgi:hypothetical protein